MSGRLGSLYNHLPPHTGYLATYINDITALKGLSSGIREKVPNKEEIHHWIGLVVRPKSDGSSLHHPCSASRVLRQCYRNDRTKEKHMNVVET